MLFALELSITLRELIVPGELSVTVPLVTGCIVTGHYLDSVPSSGRKKSGSA